MIAPFLDIDRDGRPEKNGPNGDALLSEDDQIVSYVAAGPLSAKLVKHGTLKTYKDFPHGMPTTQADTINADLLAFLKA